MNQPPLPIGVAPQPMGAYPPALDMYGQPLYNAYDPLYSGLRGTPPLPYYPRRRRSAWKRMAEALFMGSEAERLRETAVRHEMLVDGLTRERAMSMVDPYYGAYGYGGYPVPPVGRSLSLAAPVPGMGLGAAYDYYYY